MPEGGKMAIWTTREIEEIIVIARLALYNRNRPCGAEAIQRKLQSLDIHSVPSERTIERILARYGLTHGRTGWYEGDGWMAVGY